jgi:hypothetical protein
MAHFSPMLLTVPALPALETLFKLSERILACTASSVHQILVSRYLRVALTAYSEARALWIGLIRQIPLHVARPFVALALLFGLALVHRYMNESQIWQSLLGNW